MYRNEDVLKIEYTRSKDTFYIKWQMNSWCNYHCSYCVQKNQILCKPTQSEIETRAKQILNLFEYNNINKKLHLRVMGGECSIYNLIPVINILGKKLKTLNLVTNFSKPLDYFKELYLYCKEVGIHFILTCSYHDENSIFFDKMLELTAWCRQNNFKDPEINYVITKNFNKALIEDYIKRGLVRFKFNLEKLSFGRLSNEISNLQSWVEEKNKINIYNSNKNNSNYIIYFKDGHTESYNSLVPILQNFDHGGLITEGRLCDVGTNSLNITPEGLIYRNSCSLFKDIGKPIGALDNSKFELPKDWILCTNISSSKLPARCVMCSHNSVSEVINEDLYKEGLKYV